MKDKFKDALKTAMKAQDKVRMNVLRTLLTEIQYEEMNKGIENLPEADCTAVVQREVKKRKESLEMALTAKREDAVQESKNELAILESLLPQQLSASELEVIIGKLKAETPDISLNVVMKHLKDGFAGQYDGKTASEVARRVLA